MKENSKTRSCSYDPAADLIPVNYNDHDGSADEMYLEVKFRELWFTTYCEEKNIRGCIDARELTVVPFGDLCLVTSTASVIMDGETASCMSAARFIRPGDSDGIQSTVTMAVGRALKEAGFGSVNARKSEAGAFYPADAGFKMVRSADSRDEFIKTPVAGPERNTVEERKKPVNGDVKADAPAAQASTREPAPNPILQAAGSPEGMTLEEAYRVVAPVGKSAGRTIAEMMGENPAGVEWYAENYNVEKLRGTPEEIAAKRRFKAACVIVHRAFLDSCRAA